MQTVREAAHSRFTVVLGGQAGPLEIRMAGGWNLNLEKLRMPNSEACELWNHGGKAALNTRIWQ